VIERKLLYLPTPRSQPIGEAFSKVKGILRRAEARSREALTGAMGAALSAVSSHDAKGFFEHRGYCATAQLL
jgi:hypothetical protein